MQVRFAFLAKAGKGDVPPNGLWIIEPNSLTGYGF